MALFQSHYKFGVNSASSADPDSVVFGGLDTTIVQPIDTPLHIRIQTYNPSSPFADINWSLYYHTSDVPASATKVLTTGTIVKITDDVAIANEAITDVKETVFDWSGTYTWQNGIFVDTATDTSNFTFNTTAFTDIQFNIEFGSTAVAGQAYYFYLRQDDLVLGTYTNVPVVTVQQSAKQYVDTDNSAGGRDGTTSNPYNSLSEWHSAAYKNLTSNENSLTVYLKGDTLDTTSVEITGWTTSSTYDLTISTYSADPVWDGRGSKVEGTGYSLRTSHATYGIQIDSNNITIDGIEIYDLNAITNALIKVVNTATNVIVKNSIIHGVRGAAEPSLGVWNNSSGAVYIYNNVIYSIGSHPNHACIRCNSGTTFAYNNTCADSDGRAIRVVAGVLTAKNNIGVDCSGDSYNGTFENDSDYNASDDATNTGGANDRINQTFTFVDYEDGNPSIGIDLHLAATDTGARGLGTDLSADTYLSFSTDIDGNIRVTPWSIGADEEITEYYIQRKKDDGDWETVGYADDGDSTITFSNDFTLLGDGIYSYRLYLISECEETSEASDIFVLEVIDEVIVSPPQNDITELRVETIADGKFNIFFRYEPDEVQPPTHFNIYSSEVENPSQEQTPSEYEWSLDGTLNYFHTYGLFLYTSSSYSHGSTISFKVYPTIEIGSIEYEKENLLTDYSTADTEGPTISTDYKDINLV